MHIEQHMSRWQYYTIPENGYNKDIGKFHTYGIQLIGPNHKKILHDVSVCRDTVDQMVELFNLHQLLPIHLKDAVENLLP